MTLDDTQQVSQGLWRDREVKKLIQLLLGVLKSSNNDTLFLALQCLTRVMQLNPKLFKCWNVVASLLPLVQAPHTVRVRDCGFQLFSLYLGAFPASSLMQTLMKELNERPLPDATALQYLSTSHAECVCVLQWLHRHSAAIRHDASPLFCKFLETLLSLYGQSKVLYPYMSDVRARRSSHA